MSQLKTYRIVLTPLDAFFFGGEQTFGSGEEANYYAVSNFYPQQTALLGLLRQELLFQNQMDFSLIGSESFKADGSITDYGCIRQISPLLMMQQGTTVGEDEYFLFDSLEYSKDQNSNVVPVALESPRTGSVAYNESTVKTFVPGLNNYNAKEGIGTYLFSLKTGKRKQLLFNNEITGQAIDGTDNGCFEIVYQVGIKKQSEEEGFYKKQSYKLRPGFSFVFFAALELPADASLKKSNLITMGGECSPFRMEISDDAAVMKINPIGQPSDFYGLKANDKNHTPSSANKLLLLSDAFLKEAVYQHCLFAITDLVTFRNIRSNKNTRHYASLQTKDMDNLITPAKSSLFHLAKRGSVFYFEDNEREQLLDQFTNEGYAIAGFNQYLIIPHSK